MASTWTSNPVLNVIVDCAAEHDSSDEVQTTLISSQEPMATSPDREPPPSQIKPSRSLITCDSPEPSSLSSSPDSSPSTSHGGRTRRPFSTVGWEYPPQTRVDPSVRPSTTICWESSVLERASVGQGGRRYSTGNTRRRNLPEDLELWDRTRVAGGMESVDGSENNCSPKGCSREMNLLGLVQSKKKKKEKFRLLVGRLLHGTSSIINCTGEHNMTPLHFAVLSGDQLCVETLIAFGANINAKNSFNQTPLDVASENQQDHLVPLLVSIGCQRGRDIPEMSPHHPTRPRAVSSPHEVPSCSKLSSPGGAEGGAEGGAGGRKCSHRFEFCGGASSERLRKTSDRDLTEQMETNIDMRFDATQSLKPDEALAIALQEREIAKYRSKLALSSGPKSALSLGPTPMVRCVNGDRILSLDGGGIRALIQIDILCEMERLTGKKITELFDWIIGTSSGGIVALALVYKRMPLSQVRRLYFRLKDDVFSKRRVGFSYNSVRLEELLQDGLGMEQRMGDVRHPKVLIAAVDRTNLKLNFFNNCFDDEFSKQYVWKVARYTSAAPMYFTECDNYVDGGVIANNPCIDGLNKIQSFYREQGIDFPISCMVSLGSGITPSQELRPKFAGTLRNLIAMISSAIGESEALAERCQRSCEMQKIPFFRFNPQLREKIEPSMTDNYKLLQMIVTARIYTYTQETQLHQLLGLLTRKC